MKISNLMTKLISPFKRLILSVLMLFFINLLLTAQVSKTVYYNTKADSLKVSLTETEKSTVTNLTVITASGVYMTVADFAFLNAMPALTTLDLSGASITSMNTRTDNSFPRSALAENKTIKTIVFPKTLVALSRGAFTNTALEGIITLPAGVTNTSEYDLIFGGSMKISGFAVASGNSKLKSVDGVLYTIDGKTLLIYPYAKQDVSYTIPEGVTTMNSSAFGWNSYLEEIIIPSTMVTYPAQNKIINGSTRIKAFHVADGNPKLATTNGFLVDKATGTLMAFPPANTDETITIDGSIVKVIPSTYFSYATSLKNIIFTEGVKLIGYCAFKPGTNITSSLEYVELPSSLDSIGGEAFSACGNLGQIICHAIKPPGIAGVAFRGVGWVGKTKIIKVAVSAEALSTYKASHWIAAVYPTGQGFLAEDIVAYHNILRDSKVICSQKVGIAGKRVSIAAGAADEGKGFLYWQSTPAVEFSNKNNPTTTFVMPDGDVTLTAVYSSLKPYTIIDGLTLSGEAVIGASVLIEAPATKDGNAFKKWEVIEGTGVIISDPTLATTTFKMIEGTVTIKAIYEKAFTINIVGGYANLEAFAGETVSISAEIKSTKEVFDRWSTTTSGIVFANANSANTTFVMPESDVDIKANLITISGIDEPKNLLFSVYPNPATQSIQLSGVEGQSYKIYSINGLLLMQGTNYNLGPISVEHLKNGAYLIKAGTKTQMFLKK